MVNKHFNNNLYMDNQIILKPFSNIINNNNNIIQYSKDNLCKRNQNYNNSNNNNKFQIQKTTHLIS